MNVLTLAGVASQSASGIPAGAAFIASSLCLRFKRESACRQGLARTGVRAELSRPLNGYNLRDDTLAPCSPKIAHFSL